MASIDDSLSFAEAFQVTLDLFDFGVEMMRHNLKRAYPTASDEEIDDRLNAWLHERPGAEDGDCLVNRGHRGRDLRADFDDVLSTYN